MTGAILTVEDQKRIQAEEAKRRAERVPQLRAIFDGAIRYNEMLMDNPDWTDAECIAFARKWHAVAVAQAKDALSSGVMWNEGIPYCRNDISKANLGG